MAKKNNKKSKKYKKEKTNIVPIGRALQTRDEFILNGEEKPEYKNDKKTFYRTVYVVDKNDNEELAIVRSTTKRGHFLKSRPTDKFRPQIHILDNEKNPIKAGKKFVQNPSKDITNEDVEYIMQKTKKYPDTFTSLSKLHKKRSRLSRPNPDK